MSEGKTTKLRAIPKTGALFLDRQIQNVGEVAALLHQEWYDKKSEEKDDLTHPFRGCIPAGSTFEGRARVRISELTLEEANALGVKYDPTDKRDIYHDLYRPYDELAAKGSQAVRKNMLSGWAVINHTAAMLEPADSIDDLDKLLAMLISPEESCETATKLKFAQLLRKQLYNAVHTVWGAGEIMIGVDIASHPDFRLYEMLSDYMKSYDIELALVVLRWLHGKVNDLHSKPVSK